MLASILVAASSNKKIAFLKRHTPVGTQSCCHASLTLVFHVGMLVAGLQLSHGTASTYIVTNKRLYKHSNAHFTMYSAIASTSHCCRVSALCGFCMCSSCSKRYVTPLQRFCTIWRLPMECHWKALRTKKACWGRIQTWNLAQTQRKSCQTIQTHLAPLAGRQGICVLLDTCHKTNFADRLAQLSTYSAHVNTRPCRAFSLLQW